MSRFKLLALVLIGVVNPFAHAQVYSIDWFTIEPGAPSQAGIYELDSVIGQPDAGPVMSVGIYELTGGFLVGGVGPIGCDSIDFNNDGLFPDTLDIDDYLSVFSGGTCSNDPDCGDIDFNNDGLFPDTADIDALLSVFSGGTCL
jgi:hypothetical protein